MRRELFLSLLALPCLATAQTEGDGLFDTDQVITIDLTFSQPDFWDSLVANYATETYMWAGATFTDNSGTYAYDSIGVRLKGNSSYGHPGNKKSMKLDINRYVSGQNYHEEKKLNLNNGFKDPTFLREKMFMDFCRDQGVLAPRVNFANVYMNGQLWGFYTVVEQIDDQFLDRWISDDDGNLFKAGDSFGGNSNEADLKWYGSDQTLYYDRYELKNNEDVNDWSDLLDLIDLIDNSSDAVLTMQLPQRWDQETLIRSFAIDNLFANLDSYINSSRNYYIYHNATTDRWQWIKWDANEAFGQYTGGQQNLEQLSPTYAAINRPLAQRIMDIVLLRSDYLVQYCDVLDHFTNAELDPKIDALKSLIQASVYADPNKMYTNALFDQNIEQDVTLGGGMGNGPCYGLKSFITARGQYLAGAIDCTLYTGIAGDEVLDAEFNVFPNPTNGTVLINGPTLSAAATIQVIDATGRRLLDRAFDPVLDLSGLAPGTYLIRVMNGEDVRQQRIVKQ
ncbi:MAG: CotH kinase family protein [Flavobacteriales bacterium]|nr:CotH kinase family protein [Flavobacteriales bacterium]